MMLLFVGVLFIILIDNLDVIVNLVKKVTTLYPFSYFWKQRFVSPYPGMSSSIIVELHKIGWPLLFHLTVLCHMVLPSSSLITEKK